MIPDQLVAALAGAKRVAVLSGAGTSAESGVPTFRDAQSGLWANFQAEDLATPQAFARDPQTVWRWYAWRRELVRQASPNPGHHALVDLARRFAQFDLITQNVDGLHQRAGSRGVIELHGNILRSVCSATGKVIPEELIRQSSAQPPPSPHNATALARPDVVWFGESLPVDALEQALESARRCDVMLVLGTSGMVQPAASLPLSALNSGAFVAEINPEDTALSGALSVSLKARFADALPALVQALDAD